LTEETDELEELELSLSQKAHVAQRSVKKILGLSNKGLYAGIFFAGLMILLGSSTIIFIDNFGQWEFHLESIDGPRCDNLSYAVGETVGYPAQVLILKDKGAEKAGMKDGDIIKKINDYEINSVTDLFMWQENLPHISIGDTVQVVVDRYGEELFFEATTGASDLSIEAGIPIIGVWANPEPFCSQYFILNTELSEYDIPIVLLYVWGIVIIAGLVAVIMIVALFYWRPKINKVKNQLDEIENDYLEENYGVTFNTTIPEGKTEGEKIFNMSQKVFPELRKTDGSEDVWKGTLKGHNNYEFDCYQITNEEKKNDVELFIVKHFGDELITLEKLQELCDESIKSRSHADEDAAYRNIFRLICVGKNFDQSLLNNEYVEKTLEELDFEFPLDLILDDEGSYRILWIDFE